MRVVTTCFALIVALHSYAQNCENIIALSKIVSTTIEDRKSVESAAANFCQAYSKSTSNTDSSSFGIGYGLLSASFGGGSASAATIASSYCSAQNSAQARDDVYRRYIESISPDAYQSYDTCIKFSQRDLHFALDPATVLPNEFTLVTSFASKKKNAKTKLAFDSSGDVTCAWVGGKSVDQPLESGSSAALKCKRDDAGRKSYVSVFTRDAAEEPLSIPWQAYSREGFPVDTMTALQSAVVTLRADASALRTTIDTLRGKLDNIETTIPNAVDWATDPHHPGAKQGENQCDIGGQFMMGLFIDGTRVSGLSCRRLILVRR